MASANDLIVLFIGLETMSLGFYVLAASYRRKEGSAEAGMKYLVLGGFSSAFLLYGIALVYGATGSTNLTKMVDAVTNRVPVERNDALVLAGVALLLVGLGFKVAAVPFHVWTPDVYQGAPTPITAFMASCTKVAAFGALLRILYVAFEGLRWDFQPILGAVAVLTMLVGAVLAVTQTDMKRLLAYSSIANAGYLLVGVLALNKQGLSSTMFYLVAYGFSVLAAFGIVTLVRDADGEATHLSRWAGLGRKSPLFAAVFSFILLAFAGIPLTSGFTSKFAIFGAAIEGGQTWLVIVGVISSMLIAFPYLRVVVLMWLSEPGESTPTVSIPGALTSAALAIGVIATLALGVVPAPLIDLTNDAAQFVR
jgi:NADH-quinone oxidoreductase subunit N